MSKDDIIKCIEADIIDEENSGEHYNDLSLEFTKLGHLNIAQILRDMAEEEETHYKHLKYILELLGKSEVEIDSVEMLEVGKDKEVSKEYKSIFDLPRRDAY